MTLAPMCDSFMNVCAWLMPVGWFGPDAVARFDKSESDQANNIGTAGDNRRRGWAEKGKGQRVQKKRGPTGPPEIFSFGGGV